MFKKRAIISILLAISICTSLFSVSVSAKEIQASTVSVSVNPTGIALTPSSTTLNVGASKAITAIIVPYNANQTVTWTSSNTSIATVNSNGVVTAKAAGTATIGAKTINGYSAKCYVTVTTAPMSVSLNQTRLSIGVGANKLLYATVSPSNAVDTITWSSSNSAIASVSSRGNVEGKSAGTVIITAKTSNGHTASCTVTVTSVVNPTSITVNPTKTTLRVMKYKILSATILPSNATNASIIWTSSNPSVATVDFTGTILGRSSGTTIITAETQNGLKSICTVTVL